MIECAVQKQIQYGWIKLYYIIKGAFTGVNCLRWLLLIVITDANVHRKLAKETDRWKKGIERCVWEREETGMKESGADT